MLFSARWRSDIYSREILDSENLMKRDMDAMPEKENWAMLVKRLLGSWGFNNVWLAQGVGNVNMFLNVVKQTKHDNFIQNSLEFEVVRIT